jgi:hypothetical protein
MALVFVALLGIVLLLPIIAIVQNPALIVLTLLPLVGAAILLAALCGLISTYSHRNTRVVVHEHGFVHFGRDKIRVIRWEQIAYVRHSVTERATTTKPKFDGTTSTTTSFHHRYSIQCFDKTKLELNETFPRLRSLGETIETESARYLLPAVQKALYARQSVNFGALKVDRQGLTMDKERMLAWQELQEIIVDEHHGHVIIKKRGAWQDWASFALDQIPNAVVLHALVKSITE